MSHLDLLDHAIAPIREKLLDHPLTKEIRDVNDLRRFMELHCFAVWDFMSLAKRIQRELTCMDLPWIPTIDPMLARYVTEIVLQEESDLSPDGDYVSHLQLYAKAMEEVGASFQSLATVLEALVGGSELNEAFKDGVVPVAAEHFTKYNLALAQEGGLHEVLAAFVFGREDIIPELFRSLLQQTEEFDAPTFHFYLERHFAETEDDDLITPGIQLLETVCGEDQKLWTEAKNAAARALQQRIALWDGILTLILSSREETDSDVLEDTFQNERAHRGFSRVH